MKQGMKQAMRQELTADITEIGFVVRMELGIGSELSDQENKDLTNWSELFHENKHQALFLFGFVEKPLFVSTSLQYLWTIAKTMIAAITKTSDIELTREHAEISISEEELFLLVQSVPFTLGNEYINEEWITSVWNVLVGVFHQEISTFEDTVSTYLLQHNANIHVAGRIYFHLVESKMEDLPFAFLATYSTKTNDSHVKHVPLKNALLEFKDNQNKLLELLATVTRAADQSHFISNIMESGELFSPIKLNAEEGYIFLKETPLYESCGILCRIPNWWKKKTNSAQLSLNVGEKEPSKLGLDAILSFSPELSLGDDIITKEELQALLIQTEGLAFIKGKWVEIDHEKLSKLLQLYETYEQDNQGMSLAEMMRLEHEIGGSALPSIDGIDIEIQHGQWLHQFKDKLLHRKQMDILLPNSTFKAKLRPYQQVGYDWLRYMVDSNFGICLADDMGLGKTVQVIALLDYLKANNYKKVLLVIPASLIGNWQKELTKFAPHLPVSMLHGKQTTVDEESFLSITTYGMAMRLSAIQDRMWDLVILDEAQAIKNPGTKQTKGIKQLQTKGKIAMTGTPIENRLSDLWSLFDFLNPGLLGTAKEFTTFTKKLSENQQYYAQLRNMVNPFILRRLKTDKKVISDLPDKIETKEYTLLSKKQIVLYKNLVNQIQTKLEEVEGIARRGLVLASIIKFKQICNHPDQYLGNMEYKESDSGKFERLKEICETIYEKRERVLIFTQFKEMTTPIAEYLETIFHQKGLVLHGSTPIAQRSGMVDQMNGEDYVPFMVLSIKAGGVGLNLTSANHVIHFDRWWNPAVENQATDRAFRIGQTKKVMVHKFITTGSVEEKIDAMIESKSKLVQDIVASSSENWISELNNTELLQLFELEV